MSLTNTPQTKLLFDKMRHTQARQETAVNNMARSAVAGEMAKAVEPFEKALKRGDKQPGAINTTNPGHMVGKVSKASFQFKNSKSQGEPSLTGNTISPEEQLLALNEAATDFYRLEQVHKNEKARIRMIASLGGGGK